MAGEMRKRRPLFTAAFRESNPAAKAFHAPQKGPIHCRSEDEMPAISKTAKVALTSPADLAPTSPKSTSKGTRSTWRKKLRGAFGLGRRTGQRG